LLTEACEIPRLSALRRKLRVAHRLAKTSSWRKVKGKLAIIGSWDSHNLQTIGRHHFAVRCFATRFAGLP
jgi:hypothetical protein